MSNTSFPFKYRRHLSQNDPDDSDSDAEGNLDNMEDPDEDLARPKSSELIRRSASRSIDSLSGLTQVSACPRKGHCIKSNFVVYYKLLQSISIYKTEWLVIDIWTKH